MRFLMPIALIVVSIAAVVGIGTILQQSASAVSLPYTCTTQGSFVSQATGPAALGASDQAKVALASSWIEGMTHTRTTTVTNSTITPDSNYASTYQGATSGSFELEGRTFQSDASIEVTTPVTISDSYRGVVSGTVLETPSNFRWIIQAYKRLNGVISQVPVQALADGTTGNFSIDVSGVDPSVQGEWMFGLLDANASYAEYGTKWPDANYVGLEVQQYVVTDTIYYWSTTTAKTDGTFDFPNSNTGTKLFRLVDTTTNPDDILAEYIQPTGLLRSYQYQVGETGYGTALEDRSFVYDQAVALFAAIGMGDDALAKLLVEGLLKLQTSSGAHQGGFVFAAPQLSPTYTDMLYRTGAHAIATDALLAYIEKYPDDTDIDSYVTAAEEALTFLETTHSSGGTTEGLYKGGYGLYSGTPQTFDPNYAIMWASTEHNIDAWHALMRAARVLGNSSVDYRTKANTLNSAITAQLYNSAEQRFNQGADQGGPDTADPLDTNSWGAIQLYASGKPAAALTALERLPLFAYTKSGVNGYGPFYDAGGYPGATPTVWFEGSFGAALAYYRVGDYDAYRTLLDSLTLAQQNDGSFRYATDADMTYEIGTSKSVASTAWYILATAARDTIWNTCLYNPPVEPIVTTTPVVPVPSVVKRSSIPPAELSNNTVPGETVMPPDTTTSPDETPDNGEEIKENKKTDDLKGLDAKAIVIAGVSVLAVGGIIAGVVIRRKGQI